MTDFGDIGSVGVEPSAVRSIMGTWSAIECTLKSLVALTPGAAASDPMCRFWNGRRSARSKIEPRST